MFGIWEIAGTATTSPPDATFASVRDGSFWPIRWPISAVLR